MKRILQSSLFILALVCLESSDSDNSMVGPYEMPSKLVIIECIEDKAGPMARINNMNATVHRDGYNGEVIHQYQVCLGV